MRKTWKFGGVEWCAVGRKENVRFICLEPMALDIETSWNHDEDNPVCWIVSVQVLWGGKYYLYRTPSDFINFLKAIKTSYNIDNKHIIRIFIHNASFDLTYLIPYLRQAFYKETITEIDGHPVKTNNERALLAKAHKIIDYQIDGFDFRDTYILSQSSLDRWCKDLDTENKKATGFYDYDVKHYQTDKLTEEEEFYDRMDVYSLIDCVKKNNALNGDTVASMPYTMTGYVRRDLKAECNGDPEYKRMLAASKMDAEQYLMCLMAYSGGYTHCSRFVKEETRF